MKKLLLALIVVCGLAEYGSCESWWIQAGGNLPNLSANYIYALSAKQSFVDMESTIFTKKINGNPVNLNLGYVPSTDIGAIGISYDLNNMPVTVDYAWRNIIDVTISLGVIYNGTLNKWDMTLGGNIIKIVF